MTKFDATWAEREEAKRKWLAENGLYSEAEEHSSCGVGLVVSVDGKPSRKVPRRRASAAWSASPDPYPSSGR
jgi:glutamate synthase (NADPH/NADH) large chain